MRNRFLPILRYPHSSAAMAALSLLSDPIHSSTKQTLLLLLSNFLKSNAGILVSEILGSFQPISGPREGPISHATLPKGILNNSRSTSDINIPVDQITADPSPTADPSRLQVPREHERQSYCQILSPTLKATAQLECTDMVAQRKGEFLSVKVDDALVKNGVSELAHSLIDKLSLAPGDFPYTLDNLSSKLSQAWGIAGVWQLVPLGRGYYNIQITNLIDRDRILDRRTWALKPGMMRLQRWVRGFNPYKINTTLAQV